MKKILITLSAVLLSGCANYEYARNEDPYMAYLPLNTSSNIIFVQRTYPYPYSYYYYDNYYHHHNHDKPNNPPQNQTPPPPHEDKPRNEPFKPFFRTR